MTAGEVGHHGHRLGHIGVFKMFLAASKGTDDPDRIYPAELIFSHDNEEVLYTLTGSSKYPVVHGRVGIFEAIGSVIAHTSEPVVRRLSNRKAFLFGAERRRRSPEGL